MKIKVMVEIEIPDDATHYTGELTDTATWWKKKLIAGFPQWLYWDIAREEWMVHGDYAPWFIKEIEK
jgi:hypothetical protein